MLTRLLFTLASFTAVWACDPSFTGTFKLTALNTTLPNVNSTGLPLLVAQVTSSHEGRTYQLATRSSYPYSDVVPELTLVNNTLVASGGSDYASGYSLPSASVVTFFEGLPGEPQVTANPLYCAVAPINPGEYHRLVAKADAPTGLFKVCPTSWLATVFYNSTTTSSTFGECFEVDLLMIPTSSA